MKSDAIEWLNDGDGKPKRGALWGSRKTCVTPGVCTVLFPLQTVDLIAAAGRKQRRRRDGEVVERCRCAHDVHSCFVCCHVSQITFSFWLLCFSMWEPTDDTRRLVASGFLLFFTLFVHLSATRNSLFVCGRHSTCATLLQVRLVHLIFAVPVPQIQEQIVASAPSLQRSMRR